MLTINLLQTSNLHGIRFSVREVCDVLHITEKTFFNRVKAGRIAVTRDTTKTTFIGKPTIYVNGDALARSLDIFDETQARTRLNLDPLAEENPVPVDHRILADASVRKSVPAIHEPDAFSPQESDGEFRDSFGNKLTGNLSHRMFASQPEGPPVDLQTHMDPALHGTSGPSDRHSFDSGVPDAQLAAIGADWRRRNGGLCMNEQREAQERSKVAINEAFNYARRQR